MNQKVSLTKRLLLLCVATMLGMTMYAQNDQTKFSTEYRNFESKITNLLKTGQGTSADLEQLKAECANIQTEHPSEGHYALLNMGWLLLSSTSPQLSSRSLALEYFMQALESAPEDDVFTHSKALYNIGLIYFQHYQDVEQDFEKASYYFAQAAAYDNAFMVGLASMYQYGLGVERDERMALDYYAKSIERGTGAYADFYATEFALSQRKKNSLDEKSYGNYRKYYVENVINKDLAKALPYLQEAADASYPPALLDLAILYMNGQISADRDEIIRMADKYLQTAVKEKYIPAMNQYGYLWECQAKTTQDAAMKNAFKYYKMAADKGYAPAQCATGICCLKGIGTSKDLTDAGKYLVAASDQSYTRADNFLQQVETELEKDRREKQVKREERRETWRTILGIVADVSSIVSDAINTTNYTTGPSYSNSSQVYSSTPTTTSSYSNAPSSAEARRQAYRDQNQPFIYQKQVVGCTENGKVENIYIYKHLKTGEVRASTVKSDRLPSGATHKIHSKYETLRGTQYNSYICPIGVVTRFSL